MFDIVQLVDGRRHSVMKGDKVLAPTEQNEDLYEPGTVIDGQEGRDTIPGTIRNNMLQKQFCKLFLVRI